MRKPTALALALLAGMILSIPFSPSVQAGPEKAEIRKVKYYDLLLKQRVRTADPMIAFERDYLLYGAIDKEDYKAREGTYYTVFWKSKDRSPGMVVRFEYLAAKTADTLHVKEVVVDKIKRQNTTDFTVIGDEFREQGDVRAWRVSLLREGEVLTSAKSFLWE